MCLVQAIYIFQALTLPHHKTMASRNNPLCLIRAVFAGLITHQTMSSCNSHRGVSPMKPGMYEYHIPGTSLMNDDDKICYQISSFVSFSGHDEQPQ